MYLQFYGFKEAPFNLTPDSKFLFLSHRHQEALAALLFGVQERKGFISLTGEIGCGKTTLCRAMLSQLDPDQVKMCVVLNSYLTDLELLKTINEGFALPAESDSKKKLIDTLNEYLVNEFSLGHNVVLIIDESQNLRPETLEQIRMISNLETETAKLIQIILIGQPELRKTLTLPELEQLNQRITVRYHIAPLDENEVAEYIRHRLAVAEPQVDVTFSPQAVRLIFHYSRGIPRRINVICDRCLLVGYVTGTFNIDDKAVERAVNEVQGDLKSYASPTAAASQPLEPLPSSGGWRVPAGVFTLAKMAAYLVIIVLGVGVGTYLPTHYNFSRNPDASQAAPDEGAKKPAANGRKAKTTRPAAKATPAADPAVADAGATPDDPATTQALAAATPKPSPTPRPSPKPVTFANWQTDGDGILRVNTPRLSEAAAYINLIRKWNIDPDLEPFRQHTPEEVADYNMLEMVKQLNFISVRADTLTEAFVLDLPVLVHLRNPDGQDSWSVIVREPSREILEVLDPILGRRMIRRQTLEPLVADVLVLYQDSIGLTELKPGDQNDKVLKLQLWLVQEKGLDGTADFDGTPDGKFGTKTREAIQKFQLKNGLKETGRIDQITGAIIATRLNPRRPRLYS